MAIMLYVAMKTIGVREENRQSYRNGFILAAALTALAMLVSLTHLGSPLRASNAILNLGSSWLSREIFFNGVFFVCIAATAWLAYKQKGFSVFALLSLLSGAVCVFCQASIYANTVMPAWGFGHAYITFIGACLAMGAVLTGALLFRGRQKIEEGKVFAITAMSVLFVCLIAQAGIYSVLAGKLASAGPAGVRSLALLNSAGGLTVVSWILLAAGFLGYACVLHQKKVSGVLYLMTGCILAGEILNRFIFYGMGAPIGL